MKTSIDAAGRIVIPKKLRDRYGLHEGRSVAIIPLPDGISIVPELSERRFIRNGPVLSIEMSEGVALLTDFDVERLRDEQFGRKRS
jgi:AbrB family looped-hinge helix DNA binding protein